MLTFMYSDGAVVRKVLQGNQGIFRVLVDRYAGVVHSVAYAHLRNSADAEDITQETFTRFYQQLDRVAHYRQVGPWLVSVARNVSVDLLRKRVRETTVARSAGAAPAPEQNPVREELHRMLWSQLDALDAEAREVLILHYFMRKRAREIGALLDITPEAAAKRVQRAREELGRRLTDLLGEEIDEIRTDARRSERIMAAVCAMPVAWKASAAGASAAATAAGVATGASAAKMAAVVTAIALVAGIGYLGYERFAQPYSTQNIAAETSLAAEQAATAPGPGEDGTDAATTAAATTAATAPADATQTPGGKTEPDDYAMVTGSISGTVTTEDGLPAADATVSLNNDDDVEGSKNLLGVGVAIQEIEPVAISATTDAAGHYEISGVCVATARGSFPRYGIRARKSGLYAESRWMSLTHLERQATIDLILHDDLSIGGMVTDLQGKPLQGVMLTCTQEVADRREGYYGWTKEEDGLFLIEHLYAGTVSLDISSRGYLPLKTGPIAVGTLDNVFKLDPKNLISGRVVNRDTGEPVPNVMVHGVNEAVREDQRSQKEFIGAPVDAAGLFSMAACYPGTYRLSVLPPGRVPLALVLVEPLSITVGNGSISGLDLKMTAGATVRGKVIDDETGGTVGGRGYVLALSEQDLMLRRGPIELDGSYEVCGLAPGKILLRACLYPSVNSPEKREGDTITLAAGEMLKQHDIHLARRPLFSGRVVDERGEPVVAASVYAANETGSALLGDALSDTTGRFKLALRPEQAPSAVYIQAKCEGGYSEPAGPYNREDAPSDILLHIETAGKLEGELVDRQGGPVDEAVVLAIPEDADKLLLYPSRSRSSVAYGSGASVNASVNADGTFSYDSLQPGAYTLEVYLFSSVAGLPLARSTVNIQPGRTTNARLVVDVAGFGSIEGTVLMGGKPVANTNVYIDPASDEWISPHVEVTGPEGEYFAQHVLPGQVKVIVHLGTWPNGAIRKTQAVEVVADEVTRVDFDVPAGEASLEGYVSYNGTPVMSGEVLMEPIDSPGAGGIRARIDGRGWYRIEGAAEGAYRAEATLNEGGWAPINLAKAIEVQLRSGQTVRQDFELIGGEIAGAITGLKSGQIAFIAVFPGETVLPAWTVAAFEMLGERMIADTRAWRDGPFEFTGLQEGDYIVGAAALPANTAPSTVNLITAPLAMEQVHVAAGATVEVALVFDQK